MKKLSVEVFNGENPLSQLGCVWMERLIEQGSNKNKQKQSYLQSNKKTGTNQLTVV